MTNYAIIENNKIINVIVAESAEIAVEVTGKEVLETIGVPWIGDILVDGVWTKPLQPQVEEPTV